jgi:hypothetical protein
MGDLGVWEVFADELPGVFPMTNQATPDPMTATVRVPAIATEFQCRQIIVASVRSPVSSNTYGATS